MAITKAPTVTAGISINPNSLTRSISKTYDQFGETINTVADVFVFGDRCPVAADDLLSRWDWASGTITGNTAINDFSSGLDGTSLYIYGSPDYSMIDPTFLIYNIVDGLPVLTETRPATIYESLLKLKGYVDQTVASNIAPIVSLTSDLEDFLSSNVDVANGTAVIIYDDELSLSTWKFTEYAVGDDIYPCIFNEFDTGIIAADDLLIVRSSAVQFDGGPAGGSFSYDTDGFAVDTASAAILLSSETDVVLTPGVTFPISLVEPSNPPSGHVKLYYSDEFSALRLRESDGTERSVGGGGAHIEAAPTGTASSLLITTSSTTYLVNASEPYTLTLPALAGLELGWEITIADRSNQAGTHNITINANGAETFIGYSTGPLIIDTNSGLVRLQVTSLGWLVLYTK
jgi:hypothetical protein